jgi:hypothetical protein
MDLAHVRARQSSTMHRSELASLNSVAYEWRWGGELAVSATQVRDERDTVQPASISQFRDAYMFKHNIFVDFTLAGKYVRQTVLLLVRMGCSSLPVGFGHLVAQKTLANDASV